MAESLLSSNLYLTWEDIQVVADPWAPGERTLYHRKDQPGYWMQPMDPFSLYTFKYLEHVKPGAPRLKNTPGPAEPEYEPPQEVVDHPENEAPDPWGQMEEGFGHVGDGEVVDVWPALPKMIDPHDLDEKAEEVGDLSREKIFDHQIEAAGRPKQRFLHKGEEFESRPLASGIQEFRPPPGEVAPAARTTGAIELPELPSAEETVAQMEEDLRPSGFTAEWEDRILNDPDPVLDGLVDLLTDDPEPTNPEDGVELQEVSDWADAEFGDGYEAELNEFISAEFGDEPNFDQLEFGDGMLGDEDELGQDLVAQYEPELQPEFIEMQPYVTVEPPPIEEVQAFVNDDFFADGVDAGGLEMTELRVGLGLEDAAQGLIDAGLDLGTWASSAAEMLPSLGETLGFATGLASGVLIGMAANVLYDGMVPIVEHLVNTDWIKHPYDIHGMSTGEALAWAEQEKLQRDPSYHVTEAITKYFETHATYVWVLDDANAMMPATTTWLGRTWPASYGHDQYIANHTAVFKGSGLWYRGRVMSATGKRAGYRKPNVEFEDDHEIRYSLRLKPGEAKFYWVPGTKATMLEDNPLTAALCARANKDILERLQKVKDMDPSEKIFLPPFPPKIVNPWKENEPWFEGKKRFYVWDEFEGFYDMSIDSQGGRRDAVLKALREQYRYLVRHGYWGTPNMTDKARIENLRDLLYPDPSAIAKTSIPSVDTVWDVPDTEPFLDPVLMNTHKTRFDQWRDTTQKGNVKKDRRDWETKREEDPGDWYVIPEDVDWPISPVGPPPAIAPPPAGRRLLPDDYKSWEGWVRDADEGTWIEVDGKEILFSPLVKKVNRAGVERVVFGHENEIEDWRPFLRFLAELLPGGTTETIPGYKRVPDRTVHLNTNHDVSEVRELCNYAYVRRPVEGKRKTKMSNPLKAHDDDIPKTLEEAFAAGYVIWTQSFRNFRTQGLNYRGLVQYVNKIFEFEGNKDAAADFIEMTVTPKNLKRLKDMSLSEVTHTLVETMDWLTAGDKIPYSLRTRLEYQEDTLKRALHVFKGIGYQNATPDKHKTREFMQHVWRLHLKLGSQEEVIKAFNDYAATLNFDKDDFVNIYETLARGPNAPLRIILGDETLLDWLNHERNRFNLPPITGQNLSKGPLQRHDLPPKYVPRVKAPKQEVIDLSDDSSSEIEGLFTRDLEPSGPFDTAPGGARKREPDPQALPPPVHMPPELEQDDEEKQGEVLQKGMESDSDSEPPPREQPFRSGKTTHVYNEEVLAQIAAGGTHVKPEPDLPVYPDYDPDEQELGHEEDFEILPTVFWVKHKAWENNDWEDYLVFYRDKVVRASTDDRGTYEENGHQIHWQNHPSEEFVDRKVEVVVVEGPQQYEEDAPQFKAIKKITDEGEHLSVVDGLSKEHQMFLGIGMPIDPVGLDPNVEPIMDVVEPEPVGSHMRKSSIGGVLLLALLLATAASLIK